MLIGNGKLIKMEKKNNLKIENMSLKMLLVALICVSSCHQKELDSKDKLIGKWTSIDEKEPLIILEIKQNIIYRYENNNKIVYNKYSISGDTLIMTNSKFEEKHLISLLTNSKLRLGSIYPYQKDIELIDEAEFVKK